MKLKQVIASILTDLTKAQFLSDSYSSELKAAYKEDSLLRLLSVPKAEIKEIKLDLKIAFLQADRVVIYEHPSCQGKSQELREGSYEPTDDLRELHVEISTDELKQLPESALSSISITLSLSSI
jgi:hypothetical protein